jgi:hypothetical protein
MGPAYLPPPKASLELQFNGAVQHSFNLRDIHKFSFPEGKFHLLEQKGFRKDVAILFGLIFQVVWYRKLFWGVGRYRAYRAIRIVFKFSLKIRRHAQ